MRGNTGEPKEKKQSGLCSQAQRGSPYPPRGGVGVTLEGVGANKQGEAEGEDLPAGAFVGRGNTRKGIVGFFLIVILFLLVGD